VAYGGAASIEVTVGGGAAGTPGGTVHLMDGGTEVDSGTLDGTGKVTLHVPAKTFPVGAKSLIAVYDGDATHQGSQDGLTLTTSKAASTTAAADLSVVYGSPASVTVGVAATNVVATGSVTVKDGGTVLGTAVLSGGVAHVAITAGALGAGAHSLTADYAGDGNVQASTDTFTMTVSKASSTTSASVKPKQVKKGHKVKVKVTVEAANGVPVTGDVTVTLKGKSVTVTLVNGQATVKLKKVKKGGKATVAYLGSSNVEASQTTVKIKIKKSKKKK
jgi:5'-nucleotidase